jgi:hypothetical protein
MEYPTSEDEDLALLHEIYPNLTREELLQAKENLDRYFDLAIKISLRLEEEDDDDLNKKGSKENAVQ